MISDRKLRKLVSTDKKKCIDQQAAGADAGTHCSGAALQGGGALRGPGCAAGEGAGGRGHGWRGLRGRWRRRRRARARPERAARLARASIRVIWASLRNGDRFPSLMRQTHLTSGPNVDRVQQSHAGCPRSQNQLAKPPEREGYFNLFVKL